MENVSVTLNTPDNDFNIKNIRNMRHINSKAYVCYGQMMLSSQELIKNLFFLKTKQIKNKIESEN